MTVAGATRVVLPFSRKRPAGCNSISTSPGAATAASVPSNGRYAEAGPDHAVKHNAMTDPDASRLGNCRFKNWRHADMHCLAAIKLRHWSEHPDRCWLSGRCPDGNQEAIQLWHKEGGARPRNRRNTRNSPICHTFG